MKIAQIAPLMESVPPRLYGGTERVVSHLCEALVQEGQDVTLFASGELGDIGAARRLYKGGDTPQFRRSGLRAALHDHAR